MTFDPASNPWYDLGNSGPQASRLRARGVRGDQGFLMPVIRYEISADEAWTHTSPPLNRYWCFYGRIFGRESECDRLETALRAIAAARSLRGEVKWSSVTARNIETYKLLVDSFFYHVSHCDLKYRQAFLDRAFVHVPSAGTPTQ